ncbi:hypothetical protein KB206_12470 [Microvirga sp. STS02]|uniref:hypothetical protein n=1 Tax=Hymenobacter negativus TaxID=2795026 RepID=UPI0018DBECFF|nr:MULTISPECIES: hypothetical protein [Bacteria]MBH8569701.1 hypothetical protein [Hymenobacter negativus]MBR7209439.1 hypothetical protein [Microvirga sp. STS02]
MFSRFSLPLLVAPGLLLAWPASAQAPAQSAGVSLPSFYTTYRYTSYTVYDTTSLDPPTRVSGVGGTLTLRPAGTYEKRFTIPGNNNVPMLFKQDGTFTLAGDSIRFAFHDQKGADVQRGTFRFNPATRHLTITILGYPVGNRGVYELVATEPAPAAKIEKKRRR